MSIESRFPGVLFLGTDTEVGKTYQAVRLARKLQSRQVDLGVYKPVASGVLAHLQSCSTSSLLDMGSDPYQLCQAAGLDPTLLSRVCPQTYSAPLAPPAAAALEGRIVDETLIRDGFRWWQNYCKFLIVEGVGGAMSPISTSMTCLDLAIELQFPVVLVAANRLGCVSHTLLAAEAIQRRGLQLVAVILNDFGNLPMSSSLEPTFDLTENKAAQSPAGHLRRDWHRETTNSSQMLIKAFLPRVPLIHDAEELAAMHSTEC